VTTAAATVGLDAGTADSVIWAAVSWVSLLKAAEAMGVDAANVDDNGRDSDICAAVSWITVDGVSKAKAAAEVVVASEAEALGAEAVETEESEVAATWPKMLKRRLEACSGDSVWVLASTVTGAGVAVRVTVTVTIPGASVWDAKAVAEVRLLGSCFILPEDDPAAVFDP